MSLMKTGEELGYLIKEVQQEIRKRMDKILLEIELTTPQYAVLAQLEEFPGLSNADLARKSFVTPQTMNLIVQNLEGRNLVRRANSKTHGKIMNITLTDYGLTLLRKAHKLVINVEEEIFGHLSKSETNTLYLLLRKLRTGDA
jgi:DNA-binding MarR family transcriptional regulator